MQLATLILLITHLTILADKTTIRHLLFELLDKAVIQQSLDFTLITTITIVPEALHDILFGEDIRQAVVAIH